MGNNGYDSKLSFFSKDTIFQLKPSIKASTQENLLAEKLSK